MRAGRRGGTHHARQSSANDSRSRSRGREGVGARVWWVVGGGVMRRPREARDWLRWFGEIGEPTPEVA